MIGSVTWRGLTLGTGSLYGINSVEGWEDHPDIPSRDTDKGFGDGAHPGRQRVAARVVTVEGHLLDHDAAEGLVAALEAATVRSEALESLQVTQYGRTLTAQARIVRRAIPQGMDYGVGWATWALQWKCPDPLRYMADAAPASVGLPVATGGIVLPTSLPTTLGVIGSDGRLRLPNEGSATYRPEDLVVRGPLLSGFQVVDLPTGRVLRYEDALPTTADFVVLDSKRRRVLLNGTTDRRGKLTRAQWFDVPPGGTEVAWASIGADNSPDALLTATTPRGAVL